MQKFKKILVVNLIILLVYTIIFFIAYGGHHERMIYQALIMTLHAGINLLISFVLLVKRQFDVMGMYLASIRIVLIIGFSACYSGDRIF